MPGWTDRCLSADQEGEKAAKAVEFCDGSAFANYDRKGDLIGIELLAPCRLCVLNRIAVQPQVREFVRIAVQPHVREFVRIAIPRHMALAGRYGQPPRRRYDRGMEENPYKAPNSPLPRTKSKGCLVVSFVTISAALAALMAINATLALLVPYLRHGHHPRSLLIERFTCHIVGVLLLYTASRAGWNRQWRLAIPAFVGGFVVPLLLLWFLYNAVSHLQRI